ncbi:MAG: hypothetical protein UR12_C0043G0004 [candidate division TM6 bacterium GW2011_GWF2_30_66]|jgi:hypothetical protein|nr:MAG: hypothetical protein UR12_C0043G0004 [candidate division TM6 bacterium GW2011_GWF2_30_66]
MKNFIIKKNVLFFLISLSFLSIPTGIKAEDINMKKFNLSILSKTNYLALATTIINFLSNIFDKIVPQTTAGQQINPTGPQTNTTIPATQETTANQVLTEVGTVLSEVGTILTTINSAYQAVHPNKEHNNVNVLQYKY